MVFLLAQSTMLIILRSITKWISSCVVFSREGRVRTELSYVTFALYYELYMELIVMDEWA